MSTNELNTLVNLLEDPDAVVYEAVFSRFLEQGRKTIPHLEKIWTQSNDNKVREKIETIIQQINIQEVAENLQLWIDAPTASHNLLEGAYWIAKVSYPGLHFETLQKSVDDLLKDIWVALSDESLPPLNRLNIFNSFFYNKHAFNATPDLQNPVYCFINRVLETKFGNSSSLSLLYLYIAQQIGLNIQGVCIPGVSIMAYLDTAGAILCYIDPCNKGNYANREAINNYLRKSAIAPRKIYFQACSNLIVVLRLLDHTIYVYEQAHNESQASLFRSLRTLFGDRKSFVLPDEDEDSL